jgi:putative ABC transport system permease protein
MLVPMWRVAIAGVRVRWRRSLLIVATVTLGVGILGGSIVYGDTARAAFFDDLAREATGVDVAAVPSTGTPDLAGPAALKAVQEIPGVAHAESRPTATIGLLGRNGRVIANDDQPGLAFPTPTWSGFAPFRVSAGAAPQAAGQAAIDAPTAAREGITAGGRVTVLDRTGKPHQLTVSGVVDFGTSATFADRTVVVLVPADLTAYAGVFGSPGIVVAGAPGTDQAALRDRVAATLGDGYRVSTGDQLRHDLGVQSGKYVDSFLATLRVTALVALTVALLVVYNTFQILVAHRTREHALLRCVGATRRQIVTLVVAESTVVGLVAAAGSVLISIGMGYALALGQNLFGHPLPDFSLVISAKAIVVPLVAGVGITVASALLPAIAAGRVPALAALRDSTGAEPSGHRPLRTIVTLAAAAVIAGGGLELLNSGRGKGFDGLATMVAGAMIMFCALVLVMPVVIVALSAPLRWVLGRVFGPTGRLAMGNATRHPVRFGATASALMVGIAPMTAFAILLATAQAQGARELAENFPVDFVVSHVDSAGTAPFAPPLIDRLRTMPEFGTVALGQVAQVAADGCCSDVGTVDTAVLGSSLAVEVRTGDLGGLLPGTAAVTTSFAAAHAVAVGDPITIGPDGQQWRARIVATYDNAPIPADLLVNPADFAAAKLGGTDYVLIRRADRTPAATAAATLDRALADDPLAVVSSAADRRETLADSLDRRLIQFNVLLGLAMLIAVLGIANALYLSVFERTRETAMLRAVGLGKRQLYGMLAIEAILTALVGAALGVAFGLGLGWITAHELISAYGHGAPQIPAATIASYVGIAALAGAVASLLPGRFAARASVVAAIESP